MNAKKTKQKIIKVYGKNNKSKYPTTVCKVDVDTMNGYASYQQGQKETVLTKIKYIS